MIDSVDDGVGVLGGVIVMEADILAVAVVERDCENEGV